MNDRRYTVLAFTHCAACVVYVTRGPIASKRKKGDLIERESFMYKTILPNLVTWRDIQRTNENTKYYLFLFKKKYI